MQSKYAAEIANFLTVFILQLFHCCCGGLTVGVREHGVDTCLLSIMSDGHVRMFDVRIFTQTQQWVMQRKTFLFFAKLNRYVTCLRYSVSKGQHEPGSALWPCHFKNKNTSASTTAEVKMIIKI